MRANEENFLSMVTAVVSLLNDQTIVELRPIERSVLSEIESKTAEADKKNLMVRAKRGGVTKEKHDARERMNNLVLKIANAGAVYADIKGDPELWAVCRVSRTKLKKYRDSVAGPMCTGIIDAVEEVKDKLGDYGISDEDFVKAREAVEVYVERFGESESFYARKVGARKDLTAIIRELRGLLENRLDLLMNLYRTVEPEFFYQYKSARGIKDY